MLVRFRISLIFFYIFSCIGSHAGHFDWQKEIHWNWKKLKYAWEDLYFPDYFKFGVATSHFQTEGTQTDTQQTIKNNWTQSTIINLPKNFLASNHWHQWKEDIQHIKNLGVDSYRFSIGWDRIESIKGQYNQAAIDHYKELVKELKRNDIEPWICLFHFTLPVWVEQNGGWLNEENVRHYVTFCQKIFEEFHDEVKFWASFNEPLAYAVEGYMTRHFPPHHEQGPIQSIIGFYKAGKVLKNMLEAHVQFYQACKRIDSEAQIGLIHMFHILDANNHYNLLERFVASQANHLVNDSILNFFKDGVFQWKQLIKHKNEQTKNYLDFIGVNYYRHQIASFGIGNEKNGIIDARTGEKTAHDTGWALYPEGLYRSIKKASELDVPIYVTEIGIADSTGTQRDNFIRQHLYAISQAIDEGCNVRGCFFWSLMDNYEWCCDPSNGPRFGLYQVDFNTYKRSLRPDAKEFINYLKRRNELQSKIFNKLARRLHPDDHGNLA